MKPSAALEDALRGRLIVVCGPGGVGKTTTAAALALAAARSGRRTLVCTIDPSKRLRTSLGLARLTGAPQPVLKNLSAMRLDAKRTFDDLVRRHAADAAARERVLQNRFYQQISRHLAGTHEVMAMEALMGVAGDFDLVVLDTPPASSALAFLDAPHRVLQFLDGRVLRYFLKPYFVAGKLAMTPRTIVGRTLLRILDSAVGLQFLRDLSEFFLAFEGLFDSFRTTASAMEIRLREKGTSFVLVATPQSSRVQEAVAFAEALRERGLRPAALIANRVHPWAIEPPVIPDGPLGSHESRAVGEELLRLAGRELKRARAETRHLRHVSTRSGLPLVTVAELDTDVHDLRTLGRVSAGFDAGEAA